MLTACAIVKNEEASLPGMIESVCEHVDEVVILDTGSTDQTKQILADAQRDGLLNWHRSGQFNSDTQPEDFHFGQARNEALTSVREDSWVLSIDADERIDCCHRPGLDDKLSENGQQVYPIRIRNKRDRYTFFGPRLLHKANGMRWLRRVHEKPDYELSANGHLPADLLSIEHCVTKAAADSAKRNIPLLIKQMQSDGKIGYAWMEMGMELVQIGEELRAITYLHCYLKSEPDDLVARANALHALGWLYLKVGLPKAAADCAEQMIPLTPLSRAPYILAGAAWKSRGSAGLAKYYWELVLKLPQEDEWSLTINRFASDDLETTRQRLAQLDAEPTEGE